MLCKIFVLIQIIVGWVSCNHVVDIPDYNVSIVTAAVSDFVCVFQNSCCISALLSNLRLFKHRSNTRSFFCLKLLTRTHGRVSFLIESGCLSYGSRPVGGIRFTTNPVFNVVGQFIKTATHGLIAYTCLL